MKQIKRYILVLDTDKYAGNFERETTAYMTGRDDGRGEKEAEAALAALPAEMIDELDEKIISNDNDRSCEIMPTPGWVNDGNGTHYRQSRDVPPTEYQIAKCRQNMRDYKMTGLNMARLNTAKGVANWTPEALAAAEKEFADIDNKMPAWFPAYMSFGIYLDQLLMDETLKHILLRGKDYLNTNGITLEGVRLITEFYDSEETQLELP